MNRRDFVKAVGVGSLLSVVPSLANDRMGEIRTFRSSAILRDTNTGICWIDGYVIPNSHYPEDGISLLPHRVCKWK